MMKITVGNNIGAAPVKAINNSFFTAVHRGATSEIVHAKHKREQQEQFLEGYIEMGFTKDEAQAILDGQ